ncbi:hypothetical protein NQZ68_021812 [Dissostichus eleginoides]|nr:hypothetical protein NQZ68_021812 [Dissostichus eleginoides]
MSERVSYMNSGRETGETVDTSARELQKKILDSIESNGFDLSKSRGQGYDGAANMSGVYSAHMSAKLRDCLPVMSLFTSDIRMVEPLER